MSRWKLPASWLWTTTHEIANIVGGGTPPSKDKANFTTDGIPWLTPADLTGYKETYISRGARDLTEQGLASSSAKIVPRGSVLYTSRAPIGYCAIAYQPIATNQGFKNLVIPDGVSPEFLRHYLLGSEEYAKSLSSGTTFQELSATRMKTLEVPLAPLPEQHRIVTKIGALQARSRSARESLEAIKPLLETFRQSVLAGAFRGDLTADWRAQNPDVEPASELLKRIRVERRKRWEAAELAKYEAKGKKPPKEWMDKYKEPEPVDDSDLPELPEGWCWVSAKEIVDQDADIRYGIVQPGPDLPQGVPYVRGVDIQDNTILVDQLWNTSEEIANKYRNSALRGGDVLLAIIRHLKVAIVPMELDGANMARTTARLRPSSAITTEYLAQVLRSPFCQDWLKSNYRGGTSMPKVNIADAVRLPIPVAPLNEQEAVCNEITRTLDPAIVVNEAIHNSEAQLNTLDQSILAKAFRGELVPQDSNDEPASVLLERIRADREANAIVKKSKKKRARKKKPASKTST